MTNTVRELGHKAHVRIWTDAAAARGQALRSGSGAIKRLMMLCDLLNIKHIGGRWTLSTSHVHHEFWQR